LEDRFGITYQLSCIEGERPEEKAGRIAFEQTVELPQNCVPPDIRERIVGRMERLEPIAERRFEAEISYAQETVGEEFPQFLNLLFGNISLQRGILVTAVEWPASWLARFAGPSFGIDGIRRLCGVEGRRPLLSAALKPLGLSAGALARMAGRFAAAGVDIIKEDHGLADQPAAPFMERMEKCCEAVAEANAVRGGSSLYIPNLNCNSELLDSRLAVAKRMGVKSVLLSPLLIGPDTMRRVAATSGLAVLAHPALSGAYFHDDHGIAPELLLGQIFRILGADAVIYPNAGGRFPFSIERCLAIDSKLRGRLGSIRSAFPVPGGGIDSGRLSCWAKRHGPDTIFLIGGSLYARRDPAGAGGELLEMLKADFS
jgi:ribulose-bisphosphate carboxylase large chain